MKINEKKRIAVIKPSDNLLEEYKISNVGITYVDYDKNALGDSEADDDDWWSNFLNNNIEPLNIDGLIIDPSCSIEHALILIGHIRLTYNWKISSIPVVWISENDFTIVIERSKSIFFKPDSSTFFLYEYDYKGDEPLFRRLSHIFCDEAIYQNYSELNDSDSLNISSKMGSHAITNEWGAYLLSQLTSGQNLTSNIPALKHKENDLYFKYLKYKNKALFSSESLESTEYVPDNLAFNCLLIDDQHKKGWGDVLEKIIKRISSQAFLNIFDDYSLFEKTDKEINSAILEEIDKYKPHIIFLDLRLKEEEEGSKYAHRSIMDFSGGILLEKIKEEYPHISVIIFTASNKAWNMEQLIQAGADGYFIKPSPEINSDIHILKEEYKAFLELIRSCRIKANNLGAFWKYISTIQEGTTLIKGKEKELDNGRTVVEKRIIERLGMFFGLLKRNYEDSKYNKDKFFYSDLELAFMTLWSCLNDIQFIYYKKEKKFDIRIGKELIQKLKISSDDEYDVFLQKRTKRTKETKKPETLLFSNYQRNSNIYYLNNVVDESNNRKTKDKDYRISIGEQIAFLLLAFSRGDFEDLTGNKFDVNKLGDDLARIKNKRNKLYLTHGNEKKTSEFYLKTERQKREANVITLLDCAKLYEIIHFLLTARYVNIDRDSFN